MSSTEKKSEVATKISEEGVKEKEKIVGDTKTDTSAHKRPASEVNNADDEGKQKVLKTDRKDKDKENGESEKQFDEGGEDDDDVVPEGDEYDDEGEGDEDDEGEGDEDDDGEDDA